MIGQSFRQFFVIVLFLALASPAAEAALKPPTAVIRSAASAAVPAESWSIFRILSSGGRDRIVQIAVVAVAIALFIMMRKFNG